MTNSEKAVETFWKGFNCAQSVILVYAERYHIDKEVALNLTSGFGSGIARTQETCGAVTGAVMVLGLAVGKGNNDFPERKEEIYSRIQQFIKSFKEKNSSTKCRDLLNCDINTEEGIYYYDVHELHRKVCMKCITNAIEILDGIIEQAS